MCGEHSTVPTTYSAYEGSSPHVRGAHSPRNLPRTACGIIPACAGSTERHHKRWFAGRDHPRMCGEHSPSVSRCEESLGSPPHVRGARHVVIVEHLRTGIIPACAGSTCFRAGGYACRRDHPRMCGEHSMGSCSRRGCWGSSPHVRGALRRACDRGQVAGIIPACAGSTPAVHGLRTQCRDHPRMCGEHELSIPR